MELFAFRRYSLTKFGFGSTILIPFLCLRHQIRLLSSNVIPPYGVDEGVWVLQDYVAIYNFLYQCVPCFQAIIEILDGRGFDVDLLAVGLPSVFDFFYLRL